MEKESGALSLLCDLFNFSVMEEVQTGMRNKGALPPDFSFLRVLGYWDDLVKRVISFHLGMRHQGKQ